MQQGTIKFYNRNKRYGFIKGDDENEYFFHETGLSDGIYVKDDDKVEFTVVDGDRGEKAVDVSLID